MAGKDTKTKIKEIGLKLFQERGFENVTINEICEQSGVNKHTFYYYFKSKDELLKDYYELPYDIGTEYFVQILNAENYVEQLWLSYKPFLDRISESGTEISRQLFIKNINQDVGTFRGGKRRNEHMEMQASIIAKGQAAGEIRNSSDPKTLCMMIHQTFVSTLFMWCMHNGAFDLPLYIRSGVEAMLDVKPGLRAYPEISLMDIWSRDEARLERNGGHSGKREAAAQRTKRRMGRTAERSRPPKKE
ncbi:TetR/AcrR family transcriptional regulator [Christensenella tenuis]|uniref:TetR/AcrR family transcriptional regulator n=1 Tax=Christensenella tenuis TaxID=2763033 RepID=A0ABR7EJ55_9FIRM|nr:TetR/AcrR family transcriptional regulator [Christensenella tenuis]MBC5649044.1 TetR/AcrR family transcriptional regulator [Christensenella tenuis]